MLAPDEAQALIQIKNLLDVSVVSQTIVDTVYQRFVTAGEPESVYLTGFLIVAANKRAIPPSVMTILLTKAQEAITKKNGSFMAGEYARILAHAMSQVSMESRTLVYELIEQVTTQRSPMSSTLAEIYTTLIRQGFATENMLQHILQQARSAPPYKPHNPDMVMEPLPGLAIIIGYGPWLEALAVLGTLKHLSPEAIEILEARASDPALRDTIISALSNQPKWANQTCWKSSCIKMLKSISQDSNKRQLATRIMAENLSKLTHADFLTALKALEEERAAEIEPEIRIALGSLRITSQLARVRTIPIGSRLF